MKQKISVTLSSDIVAEVDRNSGSMDSRSAFLEKVLREYFDEKIRAAIDQRDLELINANADYLNREMEDVLQYQAPVDFAEGDEQ